jgi:hypothetical protein
VDARAAPDDPKVLAAQQRLGIVGAVCNDCRPARVWATRLYRYPGAADCPHPRGYYRLCQRHYDAWCARALWRGLLALPPWERAAFLANLERPPAPPDAFPPPGPLRAPAPDDPPLPAFRRSPAVERGAVERGGVTAPSVL